MAEDPKRYFTEEQANGALPELRRSLERIRQARAVVLRSAVRIREHAPADGGGLDGSAHWEALRVLREEIAGLGERGIVLRDADTGLVDFPARREGRLVYLCWRADEDRVGHWHEAGAGFGGRKPL